MAEFPAPEEGMVVTMLLIVEDVERSCRFYQHVLGAEPVWDGPPCIVQFHNTWIILNTGGGPTPDKPTVLMVTPEDPDRIDAALNIRVADIDAVVAEWTARGAEFLTEPVDFEYERRCYLRDPDGHLIEVGQSKFTP